MFLEKQKKRGAKITCKVLTAYGRQKPEDQEELFKAAPPNTRKVIFATDVAETSITIDGVRFVIDSGLTKDTIFDPMKNMTSLKGVSISQSSAVQRKGRAGRTSTGTCVRLYSQKEYGTMQEGLVPEILRVPLANTIANLLHMGIDPVAFDWLDPPEKIAIDSSLDELDLVVAITRETNTTRLTLTAMGEFICGTELNPGWARTIFESCKQGMGKAAIKLASIAQCSDIFFWRVPASDAEKRDKASEALVKLASKNGDLLTMYNIYTKTIPEEIKKSQALDSRHS